MAEPPAKRKCVPESNLYYCAHCNKEVSNSTWYRHYAEYYNPSSRTWEQRKSGAMTTSMHTDFNFDTSGSEADSKADQNTSPGPVPYEFTDDETVRLFCFL